MLGEGDVGCTDTKDQGGVDLKVGVLGRQFGEVHCNEKVFFLFSVNELDKAALDKRVHVNFLLL